MDQYVPPLVAVTTGAVIIFLCFTLRIPFFLVGLLSVAMVIYAFQDHIIQFGSQYSSATAPAFFKDNASIFITLLVIILSLGFLLFRFGPTTITTNQRTGYESSRPGSSSGLFDRLTTMFRNPWSAQSRSPSSRDFRRDMYSNDYARSSAYEGI
jgi:hypothetical protein